MASKADIWMPLYIGDYLADTAHLDAEKSGAYLHLLMHYWRKGPLPDDHALLLSVSKMRCNNAPSILQALLTEFFTLNGDGSWHQKRQDVEREKWQVKRVKAIEKAEIAAKARWGNNAPSNPLSNPLSNAKPMLDPMHTPCPLPSPLPLPLSSTEKTKTPAKGKPSQFALPEWIKPDTWAAFEQMRNLNRWKLTDQARKNIVARLERFKAEGHNPEEILQNCITNCYRGIWPVNKGRDDSPPKPAAFRLTTPEEEAQQLREGYEMWQSMSQAYRDKNPWRGGIPA